MHDVSFFFSLFRLSIWQLKLKSLQYNDQKDQVVLKVKTDKEVGKNLVSLKNSTLHQSVQRSAFKKFAKYQNNCHESQDKCIESDTVEEDPVDSTTIGETNTKKPKVTTISSFIDRLE